MEDSPQLTAVLEAVVPAIFESVAVLFLNVLLLLVVVVEVMLYVEAWGVEATAATPLGHLQ